MLSASKESRTKDMISNCPLIMWDPRGRFKSNMQHEDKPEEENYYGI